MSNSFVIDFWNFSGSILILLISSYPPDSHNIWQVCGAHKGLSEHPIRYFPSAVAMKDSSSLFHAFPTTILKKCPLKFSIKESSIKNDSDRFAESLFTLNELSPSLRMFGAKS